MKPEEYLTKISDESLEIQRAFLAENSAKLLEVARSLADCIHAGGKILILGNGGSAADAQHMAAEMVGRMQVERRALPAIALSTDTSNLTAIGNDYGYAHIFSRQLEALARRGDVVVAFSTSGRSQNVMEALETARKIGCKTVGLTGGSGGPMKERSDLLLCASLGKDSSRIQEAHAFAIHAIVDLMDRFFLGPKECSS